MCHASDSSICALAKAMSESSVKHQHCACINDTVTSDCALKWLLSVPFNGAEMLKTVLAAVHAAAGSLFHHHHQPCPIAAAALLDALYAVLNHPDVVKSLLEFLHANVDHTHQYASNGSLGKFVWFTEALKGFSPPAMLHAAACLSKLCELETSLRLCQDGSEIDTDEKGLQEGSFCHHADENKVFVVVMLAIRSGIRVSDAALMIATSLSFAECIIASACKDS